MENSTKEKVAVVGTPCHMVAASKLEKFSDVLGDSPIDIKIGLFCMENFSYSSIKKLLDKNNIDMNDIQECRVEKNYMWFYLNEDKIFKVPLNKAKSYIRKNCNICMDFTSELSDISVGSAGSEEGWSTVIVRSDKGLEFLKDAEKDSYIETKPIDEKGLKLVENLSNKKMKENIGEIHRRELVGRPVIYRRQMPIREYYEEIENCQFNDLKGDVIDIGACVLCGACDYVCPEGIIKIDDRKPQVTGKCPEGCNLCYMACPRTYVPDDIMATNADKKPLGDYLKIVSAKAPMLNGQDGGVATALLNYALAKNVVADVIVVDKNSKEPWKPEPKLTNNVADVLKAAGTKYSACTIFTPLKDLNKGKGGI